MLEVFCKQLRELQVRMCPTRTVLSARKRKPRAAESPDTGGG